MANIDALKQALQNYTGEEESLNAFVAVATAELGEDWVQTIYDTLTDLTPDEQERLNHAFQYYGATAAWGEVQSYLAQIEPLDKALIEERLPILEQWLTFFQDAGAQIVEQLRQKLVDQDLMGDEPPVQSVAPVAEPSSTDEESASPEPAEEKKDSKTLWIVEKILKEIDMTKSVQAWVSARCVELGNKEVFTYPYYGLVIDLMSQTRKDIQSILDSSDLTGDVNTFYPDQMKKLQDYKVSLDRDLEVAEQNGISDATTLIDNELTIEKARQILGGLDTSNTPEFSGPAPDGFEVIPDADTILDEQPIKKEYEQIENVVISDQEKSKNGAESQKNTSQTQENGVKKKLSFSLGHKKPTDN